MFWFDTSRQDLAFHSAAELKVTVNERQLVEMRSGLQFEHAVSLVCLGNEDTWARLRQRNWQFVS